MTETQQAVTSVSEQVTRLREGIVQYIQVEGKIREGQTETGLVRDQVYEQLGKQMNMDVAVLREKLPQAAEQLRDAPNASPFERASAAYVANDYQEAERLAIQAAVQARNATPTNNADMIRALKLAGFAAQKQIKYATAMAHLREAAELTNRERDPGQWAEIQHAIADVLIDQGQYREAATVLQGALEARASAFGPENPDTLRSRNRLAYALWRQGRFRDAEAEFRKLIAVEERLLGAQHPETLASENGLANALDDEGKHADAESEHRRVLELRSKVLGPESPETLKSRNNLALALNREQKYTEAEKQFRELITVEERVLGPEHPETLRSRRNLLVTVGNQGRHAEAEIGFRDLLAVQERMLGPEHPDTLGVRNNIGHAVAQQSRFADAEAQFRDVIRIEAKVLGPEHPATLSSRMALARVLNEQQKHAEAEAQCREVIALEENVLGPDHPTTISSWYAFAYQLARQNKTEEAMQFAQKAATAAERSLGQDHADTRKYAQLVQELDSQRSGADQANVKPVNAGVPETTAGEARPKATSALLVDPTSGQPIGRETYNGSVKVEYSDGRSEIFCKDGNCADPHVSHEGHVGWTHYTHREGRYNAAMNERLVIRFSNGQTKEFKPNPNGGPFIEEWNFIDNDVAVAIKSRGYHGPASFVRYDLISGRMTGHQDGYVEYEKMPEWAQPFSDDIPFGLRAPKADASEETLSEKGLKSETGNVKARITFVNRSKQPLKVYWLDYNGEHVLYKKLKPSESYTEDTYMTHPWLITDLHDNPWDVYMPTVQPRTVIITAPKKR